MKSLLHCSICGFLFPISRPKQKMRKAGHIKHLFCVKCSKRTAHIEGRKKW